MCQLARHAVPYWSFRCGRGDEHTQAEQSSCAPLQVTDAHDRHTLTTILQTFYNPHVLERGHKLSPSGVYLSPDLDTPKEFLDHISALPLLASPEVRSAGNDRLRFSMQKCRRRRELDLQGSMSVAWRPFLLSAPLYSSCFGGVKGVA